MTEENQRQQEQALAKPADVPAGSRPAPFVVTTAALVLINIGVYAYQGLRGTPWINPSPDELLAWGGNVAMLTLTGDAWRLVTSVFVHGGLVHLLVNMYMLLLLGSIAERRFGRLGLLLLFVAGGVVASCGSAWWQSGHTVGADLLGRQVVRLTVSVGASGAIMAVAGALIAAHAVHTWYSSDYNAPPEAALGKELLQVVAINVGMGFLIPGVDNAAHISGVLAGLIMGAPLQYIAEVASKPVTAAARLALPALMAAACAGGLLQGGGGWAELHEVRALHDEQKRAEANAAAAERQAAAREQAAIREREGLPAPVSDADARGRVIEFGDSGTSFALSADGKTAYAVDHYKNQVAVIDLGLGTVTKTIAGPKVAIKGGCMDIFCGDPAAVDIAVLRRKPLALVSSMHKDAVSFIDLAGGQEPKIVRTGKTPNAIVLSADERRAYVHNTGDHSIAVIDVETAAVIHTLQLPQQAHPPQQPGHRLPMWLGAEGARLFAVFGSYNNPQVHTFDTAAMTLLSSEALPYEINQAIQTTGGSGEVIALSEGGLRLIGPRGAQDAEVWPYCSRLQAMGFAASDKAGQPGGYVAIADYRGYNGEDSLIHVANPDSGVTIGRYPIAGVAMKLALSADGARVYAVTNGGAFVVLDTRKRMAPREEGELLCVN